VDLENRRVNFKAAVGSNGNARLAAEDELGEENGVGMESGFELGYDKLILAPGSEKNTFGAGSAGALSDDEISARRYVAP
jgi:NADH dehydrogenase FAD-containing subunit